ncbi:DPP IV N-terminal domain-containing protein [Bacteroides helcogenes]|nr:DPP IV N-terminal domain-containing protein [Bacteroides helcogenes]MDY5239633.1 DPP IV N-terminal domain-containing protein [Bacteroides helcogenes]
MNTKIMNKGILALLIAMPALFATNVMAQKTNAGIQALKKPTLEDLIPGGETYRYAENLYGLQWWGDVCIKPDIDELKAIDPKTGKETVLITRKAVNQALKAAGIKEIAHLYNVQLPWPEKTEILLPRSQRYAIYNWKTGQLTGRDDLPKEPAENFDYDTASRNLAYTVRGNLYVNGRRITDEPEGIVCGQSVHRNEFGISKGTFWSPEGHLLAFYRMDESMVTQYPLVDITARTGEVNLIRYPMAGMTSHKVYVGIYNPQSGKTVYLNTGDPTDRYFTNISWAPDGKSLYLTELNRDQNHAKLCQYNAENGELTGEIYEENHPKYVEPQSPIIFLPWDDTKFICQSQRDGYNHLYLADIKNGMKQLTQGDWLVQEVLGFNEKKKEIIIAATKESPLQSNIYKVSINSGKITPLDNGKGVHHAILSASGNYLIDNHTAPDVPRNISLVNVQNGKSFNLLTAKNPYEGFTMPDIETGTLKAADGKTDLHYRIIRPADFDPRKKYPAIVYVYGGPHAQLVTNGWMNGARGWDIYMANKGYIMFTLDNRGSSNRGLEFENATFRRLGIEEGKDQVKGVEYLKSLPYVDADRIGVHGWSFGGHMTTALMLRYPEIFKAGVAGGPVIDWSYYEIMYGERYMDTPQSNPEGYEMCNLKKLAGNLKGHLLIIHDDHDDTCVPQHTLSFMKACVDARTYPDLFIYPTHKHNVMGRDRVHLYEKITRYFEDYLAPRSIEVEGKSK